MRLALAPGSLIEPNHGGNVKNRELALMYARDTAFQMSKLRAILGKHVISKGVSVLCNEVYTKEKERLGK